MFEKKVILFLKRDSLDLYTDGGEGPKGRLQFPPEIIKYEELLDEVKFESLIASFLQKEIAAGQKIIVLLSPDIIFQKTISPQDKTNQESEVQKFRDGIPFDASKTATIKVLTTGGLNLFATNKKLYLPIVEACEKIKCQVDAVIPSVPFGITNNQELKKEDISQIFKNSKLTHASNFLLSQADTDSDLDQEESESSKKSHKNILFILLAVLIIIAALSFVLIRQKGTKDSQKKETATAQTSPKPTPTEESTAGAEVEEVSKDALKIHILNGTGVAGQAQDLADLLASDGFSNFTLSNSTITDNTQATAAFKDKVPQTIKDNLVQKLEAIFETVKVENLQESEFDIEITTGELKTP